MAYYRQENCWKCGEYYFTEDEPYTSPVDEHINARCPKCKYDPAKYVSHVDYAVGKDCVNISFMVMPTKPLEYISITFIEQPTD